MTLRTLLALLMAPALLHAAGADADWEALVALDAGPTRKPTRPAEVRDIAVEHLGRQEQGLREFLRRYPRDPRTFEARLRLARALQLKSDMFDGRIASVEVESLLREAEAMAKPDQRAEVRFARISYTMRILRTPNAQQRQQLYDLARGFQASFPNDRRLAALLTEIATRFDHEPKRKRELLDSAHAAATDEEIKARIADDTRRLDQLGLPVNLQFTPADGSPLDVADHRGKVVVLVFFAVFSQPSLEALDQIRAGLAKLPGDQVQLFGVSLDTKAEPLERLAQEKKIDWPVICDGRGWESPLVRKLGINSLPTVWLLDREGVLRSLDGLEGFAGQMREMLVRR